MNHFKKSTPLPISVLFYYKNIWEYRDCYRFYILINAHKKLYEGIT